MAQLYSRRRHGAAIQPSVFAHGTNPGSGSGPGSGLNQRDIIGAALPERNARRSETNWDVDLTAREARHRSGLRIRFLRRDGDWHPVVLLPLPRTLSAAAIGHLTHAAMEMFLTDLLRTRHHQPV